jgi:uncharacterized membrane-anchored protein
MKNHLIILLLSLAPMVSFAQMEDSDTSEYIMDLEDIQYYLEMDSIDKSFNYQYGEVTLGLGLATLTVPDGFKYLNSEQSNYVLTEIWGNPPEPTLGMLFPEEFSPLDDSLTYAVDISFSEDGFIDDEDADELDYDELLEEMQNDAEEGNEYRREQGYPTIDLIGWASEPFYDAENKKIHWAKELQFEDYEGRTLNYNIRILGRKGYLNMNAIGEMDALPYFQADIDKILYSVEFNEGNRYADFDSSMDNVAAYGIGGLIAGKILAKAGFFVVLLKFWKVIAVGAVAIFTAFKKKIFGGE